MVVVRRRKYLDSCIEKKIASIVLSVKIKELTLSHIINCDKLETINFLRNEMNRIEIGNFFFNHTKELFVFLNRFYENDI